MATEAALDDIKGVRILVVGDHGVGKTCLVHRVCFDQPPVTSPEWTTGCQSEVKLHEYPPSKRKFFVEFWDMGGHAKYQPSRDIFYSGINGILLVFDLTNRKSYDNLRRWLKEIKSIDKVRGMEEKYMYGDTLSVPSITTAPRRQIHSHHLAPMEPPSPPDRYDYAGELAAMASHAMSSSSSSLSTLTRTSRTAIPPSPSLTLHVTDLPSSSSSSGMGHHYSHSGDAATLLAAAATGVNIVPASSQWSSHSSINALPALVIGNKLDGAREATAFECMKDFGLDSVFVSSMPKAATASNMAALHAAGFDGLNAFIDRVIERRYYRSDSSSSTGKQQHHHHHPNSVMRRSPLLRNVPPPFAAPGRQPTGMTASSSSRLSSLTLPVPEQSHRGGTGSAAARSIYSSNNASSNSISSMNGYASGAPSPSSTNYASPASSSSVVSQSNSRTTSASMSSLVQHYHAANATPSSYVTRFAPPSPYNTPSTVSFADFINRSPSNDSIANAATPNGYHHQQQYHAAAATPSIPYMTPSSSLSNLSYLPTSSPSFQTNLSSSSSSSHIGPVLPGLLATNGGISGLRIDAAVAEEYHSLDDNDRLDASRPLSFALPSPMSYQDYSSPNTAAAADGHSDFSDYRTTMAGNR